MPNSEQTNWDWQPMQYDHVRVKLDDHGKGDIWINGQKLKSTFGFRIAAAASYITKISIEIMGTVEYEGPAEISINPHSQQPDMGEQVAIVDDFFGFKEVA